MRHLLLCALLSAGLAAAQAPSSTGSTEAFRQLRFRDLGPAVAGGRVTAVVGIPGNPRVYYAGAAGGGIFKSTDGGDSWRPVFAHEATASIGALAIAPSDANVVWAGTGESNLRNDIVTGAGVYISSDAGAHWRFAGLRGAGQIAAIAVDPRDPNTALVGVTGNAWAPGATRGVYRTTDAGRTWQRVLYVNDTTGVSDLVSNPADPREIFAGMWPIRRYPWEMVSGGDGGGIFRSRDGGLTWRKLTQGLPAPPTGRVGLAISRSNPRHIYALIESKQGVLWDSVDGGDHWRRVSRSPLLNARPWYFCHLAVSPTDENRVYFLSFNLLESNDGGRTFRNIGRGVHPDNHTIWIDPADAGRIIEGNDGGVYLSANGGGTWRFADGLPIEETYSVALDDRTPFDVCAGLQDNSAWCGPSAVLARGPIPNQAWWVVTGGDGQYAVPGPGTNLVYADSQNGVISVRNRVTGEGGQIRPYQLTVEEKLQSELPYRFDWTSPIAVDPREGRTVYLGGNVIFRSRDAGAHWRVISPDLTRNDKAKQVLSGGPIDTDISGAETYDTILSIAVAPTDPRVIWVGTDDGLVQTTSDGGATWRNVTPPAAPPWGRVEQIAVSPFDPATAYAAFDLHESGDNRAYVYRTRDDGATWQSIAAGLPPATPVHVVREDPNRRGLLVAGTDTGLFYSQGDGAAWAPLTAHFPTVAVYDLKFQAATHSLVVATHGRGILVLDDITPLEDLTPARRAQALVLFPPLPAIRASLFNRFGSIATQGAQWEAANRAPGAILQYYLARAAPAGVSILIKDAQGGVVRRLHAPGQAGVNRITWDLTYDAAPRPSFLHTAVQAWEPPLAAGPPVAPGDYTVALTAGSQSASQPLQVVPDPRFNVRAAALASQTQAGLAVRALIARVVRALDRRPDLRRMPYYNPDITFDSKYYLHGIGSLFDRLQRLENAIDGAYGAAPTPPMQEELRDLRAEVSAMAARAAPPTAVAAGSGRKR